MSMSTFLPWFTLTWTCMRLLLPSSSALCALGGSAIAGSGAKPTWLACLARALASSLRSSASSALTRFCCTCSRWLNSRCSSAISSWLRPILRCRWPTSACCAPTFFWFSLMSSCSSATRAWRRRRLSLAICFSVTARRASSTSFSSSSSLSSAFCTDAIALFRMRITAAAFLWSSPADTSRITTGFRSGSSSRSSPETSRITTGRLVSGVSSDTSRIATGYLGWCGGSAVRTVTGRESWSDSASFCLSSCASRL
mmetsp:Transcript_9415/g.21502  ORF Transcript_9415/g.21502 Transcript_9415/m.21502 type:complete len:255 (+) Transcript_9415:219-983(+)